jgi:prepilin-type N-terminal cleavage/methylation domain-containing protein
MRLILKLLRRRPGAFTRLENSIIKVPNSLLGFTLIELIMTIVVVSIVAIPISVTLSKHVQSVFASEDITMAINLARLDLEQMNNTAYASIVSATLNSYQGYNYNLTRTVTFVNGTSSSTESTVKVTDQVTKSGSATVLVSLTTYISKNIRYPY